MSALDVARGLDLISRKEPPMACCPHCADPTPLISTMVFRHFEFYCLECGELFGFLSPRAVEDTPELSEHHARLNAEWEEHAGTKLIIEGREATSMEAQAEHDEAMAWLGARRSNG